ncbi:hypothetical protein IGI37_002970 [Enterococcus sp. AZ194]|uniref:hypothetical protein n=1 Tax=Enterococcus sp. AZ194 TaxID=2774629 RepID=UPI003F24003C
MNYREFLNETTDKVEKMNENEAKRTLINLIRMTPVENRERVSQLLNATKKQLEEELISCQHLFEELENREYHFLIAEEDYHSDGWGLGDTFYYKDHLGSGRIIDKIFAFAEQLVFQKHFSEAVNLYKKCCALSFRVYDACVEDYYEVSFAEIQYEKIFKKDLDQVANHLLYCVYQICPPEKRAKDLYECFALEICASATLDEVFMSGPQPLEDTELFLVDWIQLLKKIDGPFAERLLLDAITISSVFNDENKLHQLARETASTHPVVYSEYIESLLARDELHQVLTVGEEAVQQIPEKSEVRSQIVKRVVEAAEQLGTPESAYRARLTAFYSDPQANNLFPLLTISLNEADRLELLHFIRVNQRVQDKQILLFFLKQFDEVYEQEKNKKGVSTGHEWQSLGYGMSSIEGLLPLFLLLLSAGGMSKTAKQMLPSTRYLYIRDFESRFTLWKSSVILTTEQKETYLDWCKREVIRVSDKLINLKQRNQYRNMAILTIVLGEAEEGCGVVGAREKMIQIATRKHSRKPRFMKELRSLIE